MKQILVKGTTTPLHGSVVVSGAKNAALPLMAATLLAEGRTVLRNVPNLSDVSAMVGLLNELGAQATFFHNENVVIVDVPLKLCSDATSDIVKTFRASYYVLGPLLARCGDAMVGLPGGCAWGARPIDLHIQGMEALGADVEVTDGTIVANGQELRGNKFRFNKISVGATANVLMAAVYADGETVLENCAIEPEITNLVDMLIAMGANIQGRETRTLTIQGASRLHPVDFEVIPDRIEAGTFMAAAAVTGGSIEITRCEPEHMTAVIEKMIESGCRVKISSSSSLYVDGPKRLKATDMTTEEYPGFPTDMQAQWMAMMTLAEGTSHITDNIYRDRFAHASELVKLGAIIEVRDNTAIVTGNATLRGGCARSTDLRGGACLILAGLHSKGNHTLVSDIFHLDRGYEHFETKLSGLGVKIGRIGCEKAMKSSSVDTPISSVVVLDRKKSQAVLHQRRRSSMAAVAA